MASIAANGITIEYETAGDPASPPMLLIMGMGAQLIAWDDLFVDALAKRGFWVIRYDNRDVGRSTWFDDAGPADVAGALTGATAPAYLLGDMAADAAGLLDGLGLASAHIVGISLGGMIAQTFAITYPERTRSLVSIMSTTGSPSVGQQHPDALQILLTAVPSDRAAVIDQDVASWRVCGSPGFAFDEDAIRERAGAAYDRAFHPEGTGRQLVAVIASGDRTERLGAVHVPTLVIHGEEDPLIDVSGGRATAAAIPGARLKIVPGMGHDLPPVLFDEFADDIAACAVGAHA